MCVCGSGELKCGTEGESFSHTQNPALDSAPLQTPTLDPDRCFDEELAEACAPSHYNVSLLAYGPLAGGTLSGDLALQG